ncbi:CHAD domain-containing protein [bacterium]|nr:CHAD domain-containing protein [bacterium]
MFRKKILTYLEKRLKGIRDNYARARESVDAEAVHDLRVHLKRTRALFALTEALDPNFHARREFRPFRALARATRRLRDIQVQLDLFDHSTRRLKQKPETFRVFLEHLEARLKRDFLASCAPEPPEALGTAAGRLQQALAALSAEASLPRAEARYHQLKGEFLDLACRADENDSVLHELRTRAKQTHYTWEITRACFGRLGGERLFVGRVKRLHGLLGDWHDREVAFEHLERHLCRGGAHSLDRSLGTLAETFRRDKERLASRCRTEIARLRAMLAPQTAAEPSTAAAQTEPAPTTPEVTT